MTDPITESLRILTDYFKEEEIDYVVVGGISVLIFGRIRTTTDIDIIIDHSRLNKQDFLEYLDKHGFDANITDLEALDQKLHGSIFNKNEMFRVDLKGKHSDKDRKSIDGAVNATFNGIKIKVDHPYSLVLNKLIFGSEQDFEDALAVYIRNSDKINLEKLNEDGINYNIENRVSEFITEVTEFINSKKNQKRS